MITTRLIFGSCLLLAAVVQARPLSPLIINPNNHHSYLLLAAATWKVSEAEAVRLGGHLATIRNQAEEDWVLNTFGSYGGQQHLLWIGLSDTTKKFHFSWSNGESASYTRWAPGEPNNVGTGEDFVAIYYPNHTQGNKWNDWNDRVADPIGLPMNGVVEIIPPAPVTAASATNLASHLVVVEISPTLIITNDSGSLRLQWPISATNYLLEATAALSQPFTMFGYSETTNVALGIYSAVITNPVPQMFFRLRKP